jgi:protein phosphatase
VRRRGRLSVARKTREVRRAKPHPGRTILLPPDALVMLIGVAGSGKTTFARRHFGAAEVVSSDAMRAVVAGDPNDQAATDDAFELLHRIVEMRLRRNRLTVVDATNVESWARQKLLDVAWRARRPAVAIVLDPGLAIALERNAQRTDGRRPAPAVRRQQRWLEQGLADIANEGFSSVVHLRDADLDVRIERDLPLAAHDGRSTAHEHPEGTLRPPR